MSSVGQVDLDYIYLQPGAWGRLGDQPVLLDTINMLKSIGITSIRQGGSFTDPAYYFCKQP